VPGPTLRLHEGVPVAVDVVNETDAVDVVHWHGQIVPPSVERGGWSRTRAMTGRTRRRSRSRRWAWAVR
jgi:FtsP/CotA-like multicopper oxidase with cupredoxin domain